MSCGSLVDVDVEVNRGEVVSVLGENGAGKSTFAKIICGLERPDAGEIRIDGERVQFNSPRAAQAAGVALIPQELAYAPELTAAENEAKALRRLAESYRDNRAVLQYELARKRLDVGAKLAENAPQPLVVRTQQGQSDSALSTLLLAQLLPRISGAGAGNVNGHTPSASA